MTRASPEVHAPRAPTPTGAVTLLALGLGVLALLGPTRALVGWALLPWTVAFLALLRLWLRHPEWLARPGILLGGAVLLRILFLLTQQDLSDDLFRYVWDGWIRTHGILPYRFTPDDPALLTLRDPVLHPALNSPGWYSIYPPVSQLVFWLGGHAHALAGWPASGWVVRVGFTLLELGGIAALLHLFRATGRSPAPLVLLAWNPLALVAVAGSGHSEGGWILAAGLLLLGVGLRLPLLAWGGWVLAVLSKGVPLLLFPLVWRALARSAGPRSTGLHLALAGCGGLLLALPFLRPDDLPRVGASIQLYAHLFAFNEGLPALLRFLGADTLLGRFGWEVGPVLRGVAVGGALWIGLRHRVDEVTQVARGALLVLGLYLVLATTVHPWYLLWVLPFLVLVPRGSGAGRLPWLWASWAALPTYLFYQGVPARPLAILFWGGMLGWWVVEERERFFRPLRRRAGRRKARWLAPYLEGATVLDLGGAEGFVSGALAEAGGGQAVVLDPGAPRRDVPPAFTPPEGGGGRDRGSPADHHRPFGPPRIQGDGTALPFPDGSFDTVLLSFVLHHTPGPEAVLAEALRVARRRVLVLESTWEGPMEHRVLRAADRFVNAGRAGAWDAPLDHRPPGAWVALARAMGARVVVADRPPGAVHRVLRLVLEPRPGGGGKAGDGSRAVDPDQRG